VVAVHLDHRHVERTPQLRHVLAPPHLHLGDDTRIGLRHDRRRAQLGHPQDVPAALVGVAPRDVVGLVAVGIEDGRRVVGWPPRRRAWRIG